MKLTERQKAILGVMGENFQEVGDIMSLTKDYYADIVLLQLHAKGLVERTDMSRPGKSRTWLGYRLTNEGKSLSIALAAKVK
jgi:predicted ArsR family transcriptional regulator